MEAFKMLPEGTWCQLINDAIIVSPVRNLDHQRRVQKIGVMVYEFVKTKDLGVVFFVPLDVYLDDKNAFQPDIIFISKENLHITQEDGVYGAPDVVIEVLSTDRKFDLRDKKKVYERTGVKEYWTVDPVSKSCKGLRNTATGFVPIGEFEGTIKLELLDLTITF